MLEARHALAFNRGNKQKLLTVVVLLIVSFTARYAVANPHDTKKYGYSDRYGELTPTEVYSLVSNLDAIVMYYANGYHPKAVSKLPTRIFPVEGYTPDRVFIALTKLTQKLNILADEYGVSRVRRVIREETEAIPAEVFLLAGSCMDTVAHILSVMEPENSLGDFYVNHRYTKPKTPSDVYSLVDLIDRKLMVILDENMQQIE